MIRTFWNRRRGIPESIRSRRKVVFGNSTTLENRQIVAISSDLMAILQRRNTQLTPAVM